MRQEKAKDQEEAEAHAHTLASDEELRRVGEVLDEVNGRLSNLMERVTHMDGLPDAADRLIRLALATDEGVRNGFANLAGIVGRFDRIEEQGREILSRIGYGNDLQATILELLNRQSVVVDFVEELRAGGVQPRNSVICWRHSTVVWLRPASVGQRRRCRVFGSSREIGQSRWLCR